MRVQALGEDKRLRPFFRAEGEPWLSGPSQFPLKLLGFFAASALWSFGVLLPVTTAHAFLHPSAIKSVLREAGPLPLLFALCASYALAIETLVDLQKFVWHQHYKAEGTEAPPLMVGFYEYVRYPNYLAEITFWSCVAGLSAALVARSRYLYDQVRIYILYICRCRCLGPSERYICSMSYFNPATFSNGCIHSECVSFSCFECF